MMWCKKCKAQLGGHAYLGYPRNQGDECIPLGPEAEIIDLRLSSDSRRSFVLGFVPGFVPYSRNVAGCAECAANSARGLRGKMAIFFAGRSQAIQAAAEAGALQTAPDAL
jgi:hypothetical protein